MCQLEMNACLLEAGGMPPGQLTYIGNGECKGKVCCLISIEDNHQRYAPRRIKGALGAYGVTQIFSNK